MIKPLNRGGPGLLSVFVLVSLVLCRVGSAQGVECSVSVGNLSFGVISGISGGPFTTTADVEVLCTAQTGYSVSIGTGDSNSYDPREMGHTANPGYKLKYNIYKDAARTVVWGDGAGVTQTVDGVGTGQVQSFTAYGSIPGNQAPHVGSYSDTVAVIVSYDP